jgi:uncharacterized Fe-S cluster protein YjdI
MVFLQVELKAGCQRRKAVVYCRDVYLVQGIFLRQAMEFCTSASACVLAGNALLSLRRAPWLGSNGEDLGRRRRLGFSSVNRCVRT